MKILVTGSTGYIGKRLIPILLNEGHHVVCAVRDVLRADKAYLDDEHISIVEADFLKPQTLSNIPKDIDVAYYLIHSMSNTSKDFESLEAQCAENFRNYLEKTELKQNETVNSTDKKDISITENTKTGTSTLNLSESKTIILTQADSSKVITIQDEMGKKLTIKGANATIQNNKLSESKKDTVNTNKITNDKSNNNVITNIEKEESKTTKTRNTDSDVKTTSTWLWISIIIGFLIVLVFLLKKYGIKIF